MRLSASKAPDETYWSQVREVRLGVADLVESLTAEELRVPSLCAGWRVRDVAGHLSLVPTITTRQLVAAAPRAGFNPHRINTALAKRYGALPQQEIVQRLREHAGRSATAAVLDARDSLFDVVVHSQDIARPLGRSFVVATPSVVSGLDRVWEMGWPFRARQRLAGLTLRTADAAWSVGQGPEVSGPAVALLLLLTGRTEAALEDLTGPGVSRLTAP